MADNIELNSGAGGSTLATDEIGGVQHQRVKIGFGADGFFQDVSEANPFPVTPGVSVSPDNTSTTPLAGGATFTGTGEQNNSPDVMVSLQTDQAGTLNFQFSPDGTNWSTFPVDGFSVEAGVHEFHTAVKGPRYFRVVFTNDAGTAQTYLRLYTYFGTFAGKTNAPLGQDINNDSDAIIVKAVSAGAQPDGDFVNAKADGTLFNTTATLLANAQYVSSWYDTDGWRNMEVIIVADQPSTTDGVVLEFTDDVQGARTVRVTKEFTFAAEDVARGFFLLKVGTLLDGVRIRYRNGATNQGSFFLQADLRTTATQPTTLNIEHPLTSADTGGVSRAIATGRKPDGSYVNTPQPGFVFSSTANVASGATYSTGLLDISGYQQIQFHVLSSHDGTIDLFYYSDEAGTDLVRTLSLPYTATDGFQLFGSPVFGDWAKYEFTNDAGVTTTDFLYQGKLLNGSLSAQVLSIDAPLTPNMTANLTRTVLVGQDAAGIFRNAPTDAEGIMKVNIHEPITAFGDLRVAPLTPQVQLMFPYNINGALTKTTVANGGSVTAVDSMAQAQTSANAAGSAVLASRDPLKYRSGCGAMARFSARYTAGVANSRQIVGMGDAEDGVFFGYNGATFGILHRVNGVDNWIPQTSWNMDKMDGSGVKTNPSQMLYDPTLLNVFQIQFQWLGAGQMEFSMEEQTTGLFVPVHRIRFANTSTTPALYNPIIPLHIEATNTGNTTNLVTRSASMSAFSEGIEVVTGPSNVVTGSATHSGEGKLFHIRNKSTYISKPNRISMILKSLSTGNDTNKLSTFKIYINATLSGTASWSDVDGNDSVAEKDTAQDYVSGGKLVFAGTVGKDAGQAFLLNNPRVTLRPGEIMTVTSVNETEGLTSATLGWQEDV